jgi:hypothetical protein
MRRPPPSFEPQRERILRWEKPGILLRHFRKPFWAFFWSFALLAVAGLLYLVIHLAKPAEAFDPTNAVSFEAGASLRPIYNLALLQRFASKASIAEISQRIEQKRQFLSQSLVRLRREALVPVMQANQTALLWNPPPPGILAKAPEKATDDDFARADLGAIDRWLAQQAPGIKAPANRSIFTVARDGVRECDEIERRYRDELKQEAQALQPVLSFCWLYTDCGWWIVEVMFWSFAGVLANTIIALILACRAHRYSAEEYTLVLPKVFLAPTLAVVFVALWTTGFTESQINYLNLPYFLVFSFLLGFATESLYTKLRDLVSLVVTPSATLSEERLQEAAKDVPYPWIHNLEQAGATPAPKNLQELEAKAIAVAKAQAERATVTGAANPHSES